MYELITIAFSHYCEKARWVLDRNRIPYRERPYMPAMHFVATRGALFGRREGEADKASTRYSTPLLRGEGVVIADSSKIVRHIEPSLFDAPEAESLDAYFGTEYGPHTRRVAYWFAFADPTLLSEMAVRNVSAPQALFFRASFPFVRSFMREALRVDEEGFRRSRERVFRVADEVEERLRDGRPYLCGDEFSAADLAFASLSAPASFPGTAHFGAWLPPVERLDPDAQRLVHEFRAHPAGVFAQRVLDEHRWPQSL